jgi:hypothetical protein
MKWNGGRAFVSEVLAREDVGLVEVEEDFLEVYYGPVFLGWLDGAGPEPVFVAEGRPPRRVRRTAARGQGGER